MLYVLSTAAKMNMFVCVSKCSISKINFMYQKFMQWLPVIVAFLAGSFALHQIRSNNITNARIKWLENLKQLVTDFFSECAVLQMKEGVSRGINERREIDPTNENAQSYYDRINESIIDHLKIIESKHDLIKLNLNPKEDLHLKFENILDNYMDFFNKIPKHKTPEEYKDLIRTMSSYSETLNLLTRYILKLEWEKTKRSFLSKEYYMKFGMGRKIKTEALELEILPKRLP
jgi:hypothetical protein